MARVTVEDCVLKVPNRFELVMVASQRAREIGAGSSLMVDRDNDKNPVVSLREIADTDISLETLRESLVKNHQKVLEVEDDEEDVIDMMEGEAEWAAVANQSAETELAEDSGEDVSETEDDSAEEETAEASMYDFAGDNFDEEN